MSSAEPSRVKTFFRMTFEKQAYALTSTGFFRKIAVFLKKGVKRNKPTQ